MHKRRDLAPVRRASYNVLHMAAIQRGRGWVPGPLGVLASGLWLSGAVGACDGGDDGPGRAEPSACELAVERSRACGLLSEGEPNCRLFESPSYGECISLCMDTATCEDMREQACNDLDNEFSFCIERCQLNLFLHFQCGDGTEIERERRCDGRSDCASGADEARCDAPEPLFECGGGESVPADDECDGERDCVDGRDEADCPTRAMTICPNGF